MQAQDDPKDMPKSGQTAAVQDQEADTLPDGLVIHAISVADGILALTRLPGASGCYQTDLNHIREWQPGLVISLTTHTEMDAVGAAALGQDVQRAASRWAHLPIEDFGAPGSSFLARWPEVSHMARKALVGGGRVLVHCRAGCGRSGMVALRLLIESGEPPAQALARLRAIRPCAVETAEQMQWAYGERRLPHATT